MVPFDKDAIEVSLLRPSEKKMLNDYHKKVYEMLAPHFTGEELKWLGEATAAV